MIVNPSHWGNNLIADTVPVALVIEEMTDAGLVDYLAERVTDDGLALTGPAGVLPKLATAVHHRLTGQPKPVQFQITWDPTDPISVTVTCSAGCTRAAIHDLCLLVGTTCTDLRPAITITRDGDAIERL